MAVRTTPDLVKGVLQGNYDGSADVAPYIRAASVILANVIRCATRKGITIDEDTLTEIETWLAAHSYTVNDPLYKARGTLGASGSFVRANEGDFLRTAKMMDPSGCVESITSGQTKRATAFSLAKPETEQLTYTERNGQRGGY